MLTGKSFDPCPPYRLKTVNDAVPHMDAYLSYFIGFGIPLLLLACGALTKKIVRGGGWRRTDFYLGVELSLAALGSAMVYIYDLRELSVQALLSSNELNRKMAILTIFLVVAFSGLLLILSIHQDWEPRTTNRARQIWMLVVFCNGIGIALFAAFVLLVKGV